MERKAIFLIISLGIIAALSGCTIPSEKFEYVGDKEPVTIPKGNHTTVILDFLVSVGAFTLEVNPAAEYLVNLESKVSVREGSNSTLENAEEVTYTEVDMETIKIQFSSDDIGKQVDYAYNITVRVNNNINLKTISRVRSSGDISMIIADSTINIIDLGLSTEKGAISLTLVNTQFSTSPLIATSAGNIDITLKNLNCTTGESWEICTSTGEITLDSTNINTPGTTLLSHRFEITCTKGDILISANHHQEYGLKITVGVITGDITIPGGEDAYTSANYFTAEQKYIFDLWTETGDIAFSSGE